MTYATKAARAEARASTAPLDHASVIAVVFCALFVLQGLVFIPYIGVQNDEALFGAAIYPPPGYQGWVKISGERIPTMLMTYLGTLKAFLYQPIFSVWEPSPWSIRIPVLLIGGLTVWLFFLLVRSFGGTRVAVAATALLATDATFVLTTCLDWGPVALQHLLMMTGLLLLWRFHKSGSLLLLAGGWFAFGLALWDKALFSWLLVGLGAATVAIFPRELFSKLTLRNVGVALVAFAIGAAPLIAYNKTSHMGTFRGNAVLSSAQIGKKFFVLRLGLEGSSLIGYMVRDQPVLEPGKPQGALERVSVELSEAMGHRRKSFFPLACLLSLALLPWIWRTPARKPMLFSLIFVAVTWVQMAFTKDTGGSTHHTVLLWPFPHLFVAAAVVWVTAAFERAGRMMFALTIALLCASNLVALNQHLAQLVERGPTTVWTDAIYPLSNYMRGLSPDRVYTMDWGILDSLRILNEGALPLRVSSAVFPRDSGEAARAAALKVIASPKTIFVGHTEESRIRRDDAQRLDDLAASEGLEKQILTVISDRHGRPIFEVYRFSGGSQPAAHWKLPHPERTHG